MSVCVCVWGGGGGTCPVFRSLCIHTKFIYCLDTRVWVDVCVPGSHGFIQLIFIMWIYKLTL